MGRGVGGDRWRAALPGGQGGGEAGVDEEGGDADEDKAEDEAALAHGALKRVRPSSTANSGK